MNEKKSYLVRTEIIEEIDFLSEELNIQLRTLPFIRRWRTVESYTGKTYLYVSVGEHDCENNVKKMQKIIKECQEL